MSIVCFHNRDDGLPYVLSHFSIKREIEHSCRSADVVKFGVSLVICTYNRPESVSRFLLSIRGQSLLPNEVIIVDASDNADTEEVIRKLPVEYLTSCFFYFRVTDPIKGLTRQRNFGVRYVHEELVAFFDDDIVLLPECLMEMVRPFTYLNNQVVGVSAFIKDGYEKRHWIWLVRYALGIIGHLRPGTYQRSGISVTWTGVKKASDLVEGEWLSGACTVWKADVVREIGFNETFTGYSLSEDLDFSLRANRVGKLFLAHRAKVLHLHESGGRPDSYKLGYMSIYNNYHIHRNLLENRRKRDVVWFWYAWILESLLLLRFVLKPDGIVMVFQQWRGRAVATYKIICETYQEGVLKD